MNLQREEQDLNSARGGAGLRNQRSESKQIGDLSERFNRTETSIGSYESDNLIMMSMKDAVQAMNERSKRHKHEKDYV